jgi:transaldolase
MYVEQLIGPDTVDTMPPATIEAFRDHGVVARTVDSDMAGADRTMQDIEAAGVDFNDVTEQLLREGIASFQKSYDSLLAGLERKRHALV